MFLQVKALVYMLDCLELSYYPPKLFPCTHEAQTCLYHIKQEDCHTDDTFMAVWWVPMEMWGSSIFFLLLVVFPVFFSFQCHRRPSRQAPGRKANSSWLEEGLICILVPRTRSEAVQSLVHWDWLCLPFSFCGRQTMRGQRKRDNSIPTSSVLRAHGAGSNCVCVFMCACMFLSTFVKWCVRSVGVCATHWSGRRVHGGMEASSWMLCVTDGGEMCVEVFMCGLCTG